MDKAEKIISKLGLKPHVEGGYFIETYKNPYTISGGQLDKNVDGDRPLSSSIYYLLKSGQYSQFHQLKFDELWFYHDGSSLQIYLIDDSGNLEEIILGPDVSKGQTPQLLVKSGIILGAEVIDKDSYSLVSCVVSPAFDYRDFTLFDKEELIKKFPYHEKLIRRVNN